jgi:hypothetical protein
MLIKSRALTLGQLLVVVVLLGLGLAHQADAVGAQAEADEQAVKDAITAFNDASTRATEAQDPTLLQSVTTESFYRELAAEMQEAWADGVAGALLVDIQWGPISVTGDQAMATTTETWALALDDGSTGQLPPERNSYTLLRDNGTWKVQANDHPDSPDNPGNLPMT